MRLSGWEQGQKPPQAMGASSLIQSRKRNVSVNAKYVRIRKDKIQNGVLRKLLLRLKHALYRKWRLPVDVHRKPHWHSKRLDWMQCRLWIESWKPSWENRHITGCPSSGKPGLMR